MSEEIHKSDLFVYDPPHVKLGQSTRKIMWLVVLSLIPSCIFSVYLYGFKAAMLISVSIVSALISELLFQLIAKKPVTVSDGSAVVTGLLVAMNLPYEIPGWIAAAGSCFAIVVVKQFSGGLGKNIFNPALSARLLIMIPALSIGKWSGKIITHENQIFDAVSQSVSFSVLNGIQPSELWNWMPSRIIEFLNSNILIKLIFIGNEDFLGISFFLLAGALFLMYKKIITWHIPLSFSGCVFVFMLLYYDFTGFPYPVTASLLHILTGSLVLGAFFMATDTVTTPVTQKGS